MINNIIFDFNGTILDDGYLCYLIEDEMIKEAGVKPISYDFYLEHFLHPVSEYYKLIGLDESKINFKEKANFFQDEYQKRWKKEAPLFKGAIETLSFLKNNGYKLYVLSASEINILQEQLKFLNILDYFDDIIGANNKEGKGKIEYGKEFVKLHNLNKDNAILIGDTTHDYEVSKELDLNVLLFSKGHNSTTRLLNTGAKVVSSYQEIQEYLLSL